MISQRGSSGFDGCLHDLPDPDTQPPQFRRLQIGCGTSRVDPRLVESFVRIDVADSGDHSLVEQDDLDRSPGSTKGFGDILRSDFRGFRTEAQEKATLEILGVFGQMNTAEAAGIHKPHPHRLQTGSVEGPTHMTVGGHETPARGNLQASRHSEPDHGGGTVFKVKNQLFPPPTDENHL